MSQKFTKITGKSKKYSINLAKIQTALKNAESLSVVEASKVLFDLDQPAFKNGASIELHFKLTINPTKSDQLIRSSVVLPNGTGREIKIVAFVPDEMIEISTKLGAFKAGNDELIAEIKKTGKVDFDVAVAHPDVMKKLPQIARVLGVAGVMPNPKTGTVGVNIEEIIKTILAGKIDYKNDKSGNLHFMVGKINSTFTPEKVAENVQAAIESVLKAKPEVIKKKYIVSAHLTTTMSPSIKLAI